MEAPDGQDVGASWTARAISARACCARPPPRRRGFGPLHRSARLEPTAASTQGPPASASRSSTP